MCAPIREFRSVINRKSCYVEEYTRLLIRIIATRFSEIEKEASDRLPYESNPEYVADGTPIPKVSSTDETFKSIWKLVSNASNYSKERVKNEFLPVALILTRMIAVHLHPLLPETTKYKTPDLLLPHCTDPTLLTLAREAVYTQNTPISTNPLFTELFEPLLPTLTTTTTPKPPTTTQHTTPQNSPPKQQSTSSHQPSP
ncbi:hypothetical protein BCR33DRAFT_735122 [Rhizoclosmatium globosum]|uniref:Uncharacterized protein n=1 Tax=Rhizoclosmatium globosum TaxID=329046 RepID=A0A1Y2CPF9_9FUNG|nr:hypothetical protein BCR33DRAFT_735122 [Rhizoclosmatium globosum]|eukprot:ORY48920.1 hypothetical protein BCR33DRAFT_735122 [Rhizoclosmatium globosum]